jgi:hypothetical protein
MRVNTDTMMSSAWILVYLLPIILAVLFVMIFFVAIFSYATTVPSTPPSGQIPMQLVPIFAVVVLLYGTMIVTLIVNIILIYKLVNRRNTHFKRQIFLFEDVVTATKAIATKRGVDAEVGLASCNRTVRETKAEETEKSAALWAILSAFVFPAVWYVWYFLMKDFYKHERREDGFWEDVSKTLDKSGIKFSVPRRTEPLPERSFALYLILTIITLGFFGVYWLYVLLKDPNRHFTYHVQIEDQLLTSLETNM